MKNFLSIEKFKELRVLFILEIIMLLLLSMLISVNKFDINYWDWKAFTILTGTPEIFKCEKCSESLTVEWDSEEGEYWVH
jgi:hypothetical protein